MQVSIDKSRLAASVEWLANVSSSQLAQASVAVEDLSNDLASAVHRLSGEAEARNHAWERRLTVARAEWDRGLDAVRAECRMQLQEADELIKLQQDESAVLKEEAELRKSQRDLVQRRLTATEAEQRRLLVRARAAVRRAEAAEAEAAEATAAADAAAAEHERARKRAEAERDVLVAALAISEGAGEYLELAADGSKPAAQREAAMLARKLESMNELVRRHAADAAGASHLIADAELQRARSERRCAALEKRLQAVEGELVARRTAVQQEAKLMRRRDAGANGGAGTVGGGGGGGQLMLTMGGAADGSPSSGIGGGGIGGGGGSGGDALVRTMADRCVLVEEMSAARVEECDALTSQLEDARAETRQAAEAETAWAAHATAVQNRCAALEALLAASEAENLSLRREVQTRAAERTADIARQRSQAEGARLATKQREAAERVAEAGLRVRQLELQQEELDTTQPTREQQQQSAQPLAASAPYVSGGSAAGSGEDKVIRAAVLGGGDASSPAKDRFVGVHGFSGFQPETKGSLPFGSYWDQDKLPRCQAPRRGGGALGGSHASGGGGGGYGSGGYGSPGFALGDEMSSTRTTCGIDGSVYSSEGRHWCDSGSAPGSTHLTEVTAADLPAATGGAADGAADGSADATSLKDFEESSHAAGSLQAAKAALGASHAERDALAEAFRLVQREVVALRRTAESDNAQLDALLARVEAADARVATAENRRSAFQSLAEAQSDELERLNEHLALAQAQVAGAHRLRTALESSSAAQAERFQLARRGESALREELMRASVEVDELKNESLRSRALLRTQEELIGRLGDRLDAQADLARLQLGLPPRAAGDHEDGSHGGVGGASAVAAYSTAAANGFAPRLIRLQLGAETRVFGSDGSLSALLPAEVAAEGHLYEQVPASYAGQGRRPSLKMGDARQSDQQRLAQAIAAADAAVEADDAESFMHGKRLPGKQEEDSRWWVGGGA